MKKLAALAGAGALLLSMAGGAFGFWSSDDITIDNHARIYNRVTTKADSGDNTVFGGMFSRSKIWTGTASAGSTVYNDVNATLIGCDCLDGDLDVDNRAKVRNKVYTKADSGDNTVFGGMLSSSRIYTGGATAVSAVDNFVNTVIVGGP